MRTLFLGWIAALGLCIGSFLTVVTSRVPVGGSVLSPPSKCPGCDVRIRWFDNIPLMSWVVLRGRCRRCGMTIPVRYPMLELVVGAVFGLVALLARPLVVPVLLVTATGVIATVTAWMIHGRPSGKVAGVGALLIVLITAGTVGVGSIISG